MRSKRGRLLYEEYEYSQSIPSRILSSSNCWM